MEDEVWLPIKCTDGRKEVSSYGRIRTAQTQQVLRQYLSRTGYFTISLWAGGKRVTFKPHRLVAEAFLPKLSIRRSHVNHKDLDKTNNHVSNLEWCTSDENVDHYFKNGFRSRITDDVVLYIRQNIERLGPTALGKKFNIGYLYVLQIANGTCKAKVHTEFIREKRPPVPKVVRKYDMEGNLVAEYQSISAAAKDNNCKIGHIQRVCENQRHSLKGFVYKSDGYKQKPRDRSKDAERLAKLRENTRIRKLEK